MAIVVIIFVALVAIGAAYLLFGRQPGPSAPRGENQPPEVENRPPPVGSYTSQNFKFKLDYPESWRLFSERERAQGILLWFWHENNTIGVFPLAEPPLRGAYVLISASPKEPEDITLENLVAMKLVPEGWSVISEGQTELGGEPAWERILRDIPQSGEVSGENYVSYGMHWEIFALHGGFDYEIEFSVGYSYPEDQIPANPFAAIEVDLEKYRADFEYFLETFEFIL